MTRGLPIYVWPLLALALFSGGCIGVTPPQNVSDPVAVYLCDYGVHSGVVMPSGDDRFVEYAWGDWGYSRDNNVGPHDALGALFLSGSSALGRRFYPAVDGKPPTVIRNRPHQVATVQTIYASRKAVERWVALLDERYRSSVTKVPYYNPANRMYYVRDNARYGLLHNCNHLTTKTLEALGCKVGGLVMVASYRVKPPPESVRLAVARAAAMEAEAKRARVAERVTSAGDAARPAASRDEPLVVPAEPAPSSAQLSSTSEERPGS